MRKVTQIAWDDTAGRLLAVCADGTVWSKLQGAAWERIPGPPEGDGAPEPTLEETGKRLRQRGRGVVIGRGL